MKISFEDLAVHPLVKEAATIVEKLVENNEFFLHTFGSVLHQIAGESSVIKSNITDDDILQIRTRLDCTVSYIMESPQNSYMECDLESPGIASEIIMSPLVRSPSTF